MSTRKPNLRADSSSLELLSALYDASTGLVGSIKSVDVTPEMKPRLNQLNRVRRLVGHHLRQQGARADADDQWDRSE